MNGYLLDTNVVSELRKGNRTNSNVLSWFQTIGDAEIFLSVLVLGEIRSGIERIRRTDKSQATILDRWLKGLEGTYADRVLAVTSDIADKWGHLSALDPPSVVDGLLAATALEHGLTLVTRNVQDVQRTGAKLFNPFRPKS